MAMHRHIESVLIVDDSRTVREVMKIYLSKFKVEIQEAENGRAALDLIRHREHLVYIVNLNMPIMDGREFIRLLRKRYPHAVILVQSGMESAEKILEIMRMGVFDYVLKTIDPVSFERSLEKAIRHARLLRQTELDKARFRKELKKLRAIQISQQPRFDKITDYDISFSVLPMEDLSGDFVDGYFVDPDHTVYQIIICDVSGHGIVSSYIGTEIRGIFRAMSSSYDNLSELVQRANDKIFQSISSSSYFATAAVCRLDFRNGSISYVSAGHPESMYLHFDRKSIEIIRNSGPLLGIYPDRTYTLREMPMKPGDLLFLYTDGITESVSESGKEMYGSKRLSDVLKQNGHFSSMEIIHEILGSLYEFTGFGAQEDDISLICIQKK